MSRVWRWMESVMFLNQWVRWLPLICLASLFLCTPSDTLRSMPPQEGDIPFQHIIIDKDYPGGDCRSVGDLNGDGYPDVVAASEHVLAWYEYPTWAKHIIAYGTNFTTDMQLADIDRDGHLDVIVPDGEKGKLCWFENPEPSGNPSTDPWKCHLMGYQGTWAHDVETGDIDGDGKLDVVTRKGNAHEPGTTIVWLQSNPDSWVRIVVPTGMRGEGTALADINRDGCLDLVQNGYWLECPRQDPTHGTWTRHNIAEGWPDMVGVAAADMNGDGRVDVLLAPAESHGRLSWYEAPADPIRGKWKEHVIDSDVDFIHTFKVADMNNDGHLDVVTAEMQQSGYHPEIHSRARVSVYINEGDSLHWRQQVVATTGGHNLRVGDIGSDGAIDIISANWGGKYAPLELWLNKLNENRKLSLDKWTYIQVDDHKTKWGDYEPPTWLKYFGLAMADVTGDGYKDIVSGRYFYRNPGGDMMGKWDRVDFGMNMDGMLMVDVDGDGRPDVIAERLPEVYWLKPLDPQGNSWKAYKIGTAPATGHVNGQGYGVARLVPGPKPQIVLATGGGIYYFQIPADPEKGSWPRTLVTNQATDEGFAVADFNGDGRLDIAAGLGEGVHEGKEVAWWENPGNGQGNWTMHHVGSTGEWKDRTSAADLNGDGHPDIIVSEESVWKGTSVFWFEQPPGASSSDWPRHKLVTQFTTNSVDVADMNNDGVPDIITGEHRGTKKLAIWENVEHAASFIEHVVSAGRENHLGAQVTDMDGDGDLDIAGIAWDGYEYVHLWRNDARYRLGGAREVAPPKIDPAGGNSTQPFVVHLKSATPGATIRYTLDGSYPTISSTLFAEPLTLTGSCTLKARAFKDGMSDSNIAKADFVTSYHY